jgi:hypothetical protein
MLKREEYRDLRQAEELVATSPAAREIVNAIVAGTVGTVKVSAPSGGATTQPDGAATTVSPSGVPPR